jgi:Kef-type K+ transport system membrane component KefB/nucleotide-binding universal stress UspA family protein
MHGLTEQNVFLFLLQFALMLAAARGLGALARRLKQPTVMGELIAGVLLGPAVLGHFWPAVHAAIFPPDQVQQHLLEMLSWLGMIFLILRTGLEVDLRLWRFLGRAALLTSLFGIVIPYATGFAMGQWMPASLLVAGKDRTVFAMFLATCMSISAVKVIAKTLLELKLMRRDIGAIILAASMTDDTIGWVLLSVVSSIALSGVVSPGTVAKPLGATFGCLLAAILIVRPLMRTVIGWIERGEHLEHATTSAIVVLTLGCAAVTERLGIHAVFGAFIAGVLVTEMPRVRQSTLDALDSVIIGVFAPVFFVYTGLKVTSLALPPWQVTLLILGVAIVGKVLGAGLGARLGGLKLAPALAVGIGMSSRGSMELVVARIGLDLGVLSGTIYAAIVLLPLVTSITTPVLLRLAVSRIKPDEKESERLEEEAENEKAIIKREGTKILAATTGGPRSLQAMRIAAPIARLPGATMVALSVKPAAPERQMLLQRRSVQTVEETNQVLEQFTTEEKLPDFHPRVVTSLSPVAALREELRQGYDLVFLGAGRRRMVANRMISAVLEEGGPDVVLLSGESFPRSFRRILVATAGGFAARGAAELAILYGKSTGAQVHAVHIVEATAAGVSTQERQLTVGTSLVAEIAALGEKSGVRVDSWVRQSASSPRAILAAAQEVGADLVILGAIPRVLGRRLYLGNTAEYVLGHAQAAVAVFVPGMRRAVAAKAA